MNILKLNNLKKYRKTIIVALAILMTTILLSSNNNESPAPEILELQPEQQVIKQPERQLWLQNKSINPDYQGEIIFDSGVINKSFVQAKGTLDSNGDLYKFYTKNGKRVKNPKGYTGNDVYIWTNWKDMTYDYNIEGGSVFMDYRNSLDDQNVIIYGHHFSKSAGNDPDRNKAFTPLENALNADNVDDYRTLRLILDNETRYYELAYVYNYDVTNEFYNKNCQYYRTNYNYNEFIDNPDEGYYQTYIDSLEKVKLYDTGVKLETSDKTLTLQTCISGHDGEIFEVCVYKLVNTEYFD